MPQDPETKILKLEHPICARPGCPSCMSNVVLAAVAAVQAATEADPVPDEERGARMLYDLLLVAAMHTLEGPLRRDAFLAGADVAFTTALMLEAAKNSNMDVIVALQRLN